MKDQRQALPDAPAIAEQDERQQMLQLTRLAEIRAAQCEQLLRRMREFSFFVLLGTLLVGVDLGVLFSKWWWGL
jgi:hypothetical protein